MFFSFLLSGNQVMQIRQEGSQANDNTSVNVFSKSLSISPNSPGFQLPWGRRHHLSPSSLLSEDTPGLSEAPLHRLLPWRFDFQSTLMGTLSPSVSFPQYSLELPPNIRWIYPWKKKKNGLYCLWIRPGWINKDHFFVLADNSLTKLCAELHINAKLNFPQLLRFIIRIHFRWT